MKKDASRILELDALRGIAALLVVFFHFTMNKPQAQFGFNVGCTGVDLFFIISGFVIMMSLDYCQTPKDFIISRVSRIYPNYWVCVTLSFIINIIWAAVYGGTFDVVQYVGNLTMFQYYLKIENLDGPYWTMIIEMLFYLFMLVLFYLKALDKLVSINLFILIGTVSITFLAPDYYVKLMFSAIPLLRFWALFYAGILFYNLLKTPHNKWRNYSLLILCFSAQVYLYPHAGVAHGFINLNTYAAMLILYFGAFFLFTRNQLGFIANKYLIFSGSISYALYLIHQKLSVNVLMPYLTEKLKINFWVASIGITLPVLVLLAFLITTYLDQPMHMGLKRYLRKKWLKPPITGQLA